MADLSTTILAGTEEMSRASQGLAKAKGAQQERKLAALETLGESAASMGDSYKKYGDWQKAHQDEKAQIDVLAAENLGLRTKGQAGALTGLGATPAPTLGSAKLRASRIDHYTKMVQDKLKQDVEVKLQTAQADKATADAKKIQQEIDLKNDDTSQRERFFRDYTPPVNESPEHHTMIEMARTGSIDMKELAKFISLEEAHRVAAETSMKNTAAKRASIEAAGNRANATRLLVAGMTNMTKTDIADKNRAARVDWENNKLDFNKDNAWNANNLTAQANAIRQAYDVARIQHMGDRNFRETMRELLASDQQSIAAARLALKNESWGTPEEKQSLVTAVDTYDNTIKSMQRELKLFADKSDQGMQDVPTPVLRDPRATKTGGPVVTPDKMDDDALDAAIKAAEKANKK